MEYTINKLAKMAGVSTRTLRWYDECGLLKPNRISSNGYRIYSRLEIDRLQQILFYRELGIELSEIGKILAAKEFDGLAALISHHAALCVKKEQLELLIVNVEKSIKAMKGEITMTDNEKFEGFKQKLVNENEEKYGEEVRIKYGSGVVDASNAKLMGLSKEDYDKAEKLSLEVNEAIKSAVEQGDPTSELAQKACDLHKQWLCMFWQDGAYSKEAHLEIAEMYVADERFAKYYEDIAPGGAVFLRDAIKIYCGE
jgi:DNA-binding transcriptional MerR regulator